MSNLCVLIVLLVHVQQVLYMHTVQQMCHSNGMTELQTLHRAQQTLMILSISGQSSPALLIT